MRLHERVLQTADNRPDDIALVGPDAQLSYRELAAAVRALATELHRDTVPGDRVAVLSEKRAVTVVAMLSAAAAGLSYVPLDARMPRQRRQHIVTDSGATRTLAGAGFAADDLSELADGTLEIDLTALLAAGAESDDDLPPVRDDDEAYVLYTSGSTGTPKGVQITHRNAETFVDWAVDAFPLTPRDRVAGHAPLHFDLPVYDVYVTLSAGAALHLVDERTALFPQALLEFLRDRAITVLYAVPTALSALVRRTTLPNDRLPALRRVMYAGEEFHADALAALMQALPRAVVANLYGPIETNVVTSHVLRGPPQPGDRVPIGRANPGVATALRAEDGTVSFEGPDEAELLVAGPCVTPGYLGRPEQTGSALVTVDGDPAGRRWYRTGDIVHRDADGLLHLLGRRDGMVKVRGFRVELGEIETVISAHPGVNQAVVVATTPENRPAELHALVTPAATQDGLATAIRAACTDRLPNYMVPGRVHVVTNLPLTGSGKISRSAASTIAAAASEDGR